MKNFYPTYLYVKTHNKTGLKYFGKTTKSNPNSYWGSGKHWLRHLKKHGNDVTTEIIGFFTNREECVKVAIEFSESNRIVESKEWSNMRPENGLDGGATRYGPHSEVTKQKIGDSQRGKILSDDTKRLLKEARSKQVNVRQKGEWSQTESAKQKIREKRAKQIITPESREKAALKLRGIKRPDVSVRLTGIKRSAETIEKMSVAQRNRGPKSEETKKKISDTLLGRNLPDEVKEKLKGKVVSVNKNGEVKRIDKEIFYQQDGPVELREWVFHNSKEGKKRKQR
jgi:hypothetical protein